MKLIATKPMRYNTRRLLPGDVFEATPAHGKLLVGIRKAVASVERSPGKIDPPPADLLAKVPSAARAAHPAAPPAAANGVEANEADPALAQLHIDAEAVGITVDKRWGAKRLQAAIDNALKK